MTFKLLKRIIYAHTYMCARYYGAKNMKNARKSIGKRIFLELAYIFINIFFLLVTEIMVKNQINFYDFKITVYRNVKLLLIFIKIICPKNGAPVKVYIIFV